VRQALLPMPLLPRNGKCRAAYLPSHCGRKPTGRRYARSQQARRPPRPMVEMRGARGTGAFRHCISSCNHSPARGDACREETLKPSHHCALVAPRRRLHSLKVGRTRRRRYRNAFPERRLDAPVGMIVIGAQRSRGTLREPCLSFCRILRVHTRDNSGSPIAQSTCADSASPAT